MTDEINYGTLHGTKYQKPIKKIQEALGVCSSTVTLGERKGRGFPRDIWQQQETYLVVMTGRLLLYEWVGARDAAQHRTVPRRTPLHLCDLRWKILALVDLQDKLTENS